MLSATRCLRRPHTAAAVVVVTVAHLALRLAMLPGRQGPMNVADETGYLVNARVLAGGVPGALEHAQFYRGGYSVLLLPALWLGDTPTEQYRLALATNAVLSSLVVPLLYVLLRHVFAVPPRRALLVAAVAAAYPPLVVTTQMAWSESLLVPLVLALTSAVAAMARPSGHPAARALLVGALLGSGWAVHGRFAPVVAAGLAASALVALRRPIVLPAALAGLAATWVPSGLLNDHLRRASWAGAQGTSETALVLGNARDVDVLLSVAAIGAGQLWYLVVATFGLAALGLAALCSSVRAGLREGVASPPVVAAVFVLASFTGLLLVAAVFLHSATRPDHVVYGRYVEVFAPLLLALGIHRLLRQQRHVREVLGAFVLAGAAAAVFLPYKDGLVGRSPVNWLTVLALPPLAQTREQISPVQALLASGLGAAVIVLLLRRSAVLAQLSLVTALVLSAVAVRLVLMDDKVYDVDVPLHAVAGLRAAPVVGYDMAAFSALGLYSYQWQLGSSSFLLFDSRRDRLPDSEWVIGGTAPPRGTPDGARRVWVQEELGQAVWRLPRRVGQG